MGLNSWMGSKIKKLEWTDISLIKISVATFALLAAKFYPVLLSAEWHWYAIIVVLAGARPFYRVYMKK